jgi:imidazolonepropionase-like amidohydrolase
MRCGRLGVLSGAAWLSALPAVGHETVLRAGHLIDPASGAVSADQLILIKDGKIRAVGPKPDLLAGTPVVDLSASWVLPGLMDAHVHITCGQQPPLRIGSVYQEEGSALRALRGLRYARQLLEGGFTTVRDAGNEANCASVDLRKAIERGWFVGPTVVTMGKIIGPFGGQFVGAPPEAGLFWQFEYLDADTPDEVRKAARRNIFYGSQAVKLVCDNSPYRCSEAEVRAAVEEAHGAGLPVGVHVLGDAAARKVILGGADSIEHGSALSDELLQLMKERNTVLVGTDFPTDQLVQLLPSGNSWGIDAKEMGAAILDRLKRARRIGVPLAFGTDVTMEVAGRTRVDLMLDYLDVWAAAGITPPEALKAMITTPADLLRVKNERGAIAVGQAADIVATPENPLLSLRALRKIDFVMKNGEIVRRPGSR